MGMFSGAKAYSTTGEFRDRIAQQGTMEAAAQTYSNYRVQQALARQAALQNMMSLYNGPNRALAGISGGMGADMSHVTNNPFASASPGYFNVGRSAATTAGDHNTPVNAISTSTAGTQGFNLGGYNNNSNISTTQAPGAYIDYTMTGTPPPRPVGGNPFSYRPGGQR